MILTRPDTPYEGDPERAEAIDRVWRLIAEECSGDCCALASSLDECVQGVVASLWNASRVRTYVPLLALREVRECIRNGACHAEAEGWLR